MNYDQGSMKYIFNLLEQIIIIKKDNHLCPSGILINMKELSITLTGTICIQPLCCCSVWIMPKIKLNSSVSTQPFFFTYSYIGRMFFLNIKFYTSSSFSTHPFFFTCLCLGQKKKYVCLRSPDLP